MRKLSVYVETSVWSHAFAEDAPPLRAATEQFLLDARDGKYDLYVSDIVFREFAGAERQLAVQLRSLAESFNPVRFAFDEEMVRLAREFVLHGVVPPSKADDAKHVAAAVVRDLDIMVSWNYKHLVNIRRRENFHHVSALNGYFKPLEIVTPPEVNDG